MPVTPTLSHRWPVGAFFGLLALLGVALYQDYGVGWDEQVDRLNGIINAKYVAMKLAPEIARRQPSFAEIPDLHGSQDTDHGVLYQLPLVLLEKVARVENTRDVYFLRHLTIWLTCVAGTWVVYRLGAWRFGSWQWGLVVAGLLVLSPRLFAESFYNYKDPVFMGFFALAIYTMLGWLRQPTWQRATLHALACAAAIDNRTMGVLLVPMTISFAGLELMFRRNEWQRFIGSFALYLPLTAVGVVLAWPYLWENPVENFVEAFQSFSRYRSDMLTHYLGQDISVQALPWHYAPIWIFVTTPLLYSGLFAVGIGVVVRAALRPLHWLASPMGRADLLLLAWFIGPVLAVIVFHSVLYDGWRHLYFIYPAFLLLAVRGLQALWQAWHHLHSAPLKKITGWVGTVVLGVCLAHTVVRMALDHPYQNVYFSIPPVATTGMLFERDYWALSGRGGLEWILAHDTASTVPIGTDARTRLALHNALLLLSPPQRARVRMVPPNQALYFLGTYRWHPEAYPNSYGPAVFEQRVNGLPILSIFRLR